MKRFFFFCLLAVFPFFLCADMEITTQESVSNTLIPERLRGEFSFEEEHKNSNVIKEHLNALVAEVKQFDAKNELCQGGGYRLSPSYQYKENKPVFVGYKGNLFFSCELNSVEQYNMLVERVEKIKAPSVITHQGALAWVVSDATHNANRLALRSSLLKVAHEQAASFSKETHQICVVKEVVFDNASPTHPVLMRAAAPMAKSFSSVSTEAPLVHPETFVLGATVRYACTTDK
ncbi:SIMPL domain-containing protein [Sulfurospirillum barnesii]|uniref:Periplasmic/secreted protein n=1 Tax=Sulfurospirillum barnesii (strain ATCC 700032 / DSM 10660 / SES-3) TaxID=760154 RepID=I3XY21_SULBS|nr:SIMPL domain-containing protein [Sulfurospirillum barnesii]AFL68845.1 hypothetical protein Sulba_1557 [Sulfurospirillum barnesii SES-3]